MKKLSATFILFWQILVAFSQNSTQNITSKIESVSLFLNGGQINRSAKVNISVGRTELIFKGLSPQLEKQSIQVSSEGNFTILSVVHQTSANSDKAKQDEASIIEKQKNDIEEKIRIERSELLVYKREEEMLLKNQVIGGTYSGTKISDLKEAVDYQRLRMQEALKKQIEIDNTIRKFENEIRLLNQKLTTISNSKEQTMSEIAVTVSSKQAVNNAEFSLSYFVQNAGWLPTYDIRVESISQPINLGFKANVYQYTGEDWKDVKLILSNANPKKNGNAPTLKTWIWGTNNNYSDYYGKVDNQQITITNEVMGQVRSKFDNAPLPGVSVQIKGTSLGVQTDLNGLYKLAIPPSLKRADISLVFSFVGMKSKEIKPRNLIEDIILDEDEQALQEVVVAGYGTQLKKSALGSVSVPKDQLQGKISGMNVRQTLALDMEETESAITQNFEIKLPYSVPSDGKVYTVEVKEETLPADYQHFCIPKIDTDVFLHAHVLDWEKYRLLEGEASLYYEGTYVGKTVLNLNNKDTLTISLGRDKNVVVSRTKLKEFQKRQFIGNNKIDTRKFEISVRNTKQQPINMLVEDQFPISNYKSVEISDKTAPEAEENTETGKISWKFTLEPAKQKKLNFGFTVKSPKSGFVEVE